jgi:uncharacterized protein YbjT (DUF2867 family)
LESSKTLSNHQILALTRSAESAAAKKIAQLPRVKVEEQNWVEITEEWLRERDVARVFIASHNQPNQFAEESQFHVNCLRAGVKYVVRISTTAANVHPDFPAYYPRTHWAIEAMLSQPEFRNISWSSLQPNGFLPMFLQPAASFIKQYQKTGKQGTLSLMVNKDGPIGLVDSDDVGRVAAHLLAQDDTAPHNRAKYVVNGPEDITGEETVKLVEAYIGTKVESVKYEDLSLIDQMADQSSESRNLIMSIKKAPVTGWESQSFHDQQRNPRTGCTEAYGSSGVEVVDGRAIGQKRTDPESFEGQPWVSERGSNVSWQTHGEIRALTCSSLQQSTTPGGLKYFHRVTRGVLTISASSSPILSSW